MTRRAATSSRKIENEKLIVSLGISQDCHASAEETRRFTFAERILMSSAVLSIVALVEG